MAIYGITEFSQDLYGFDFPPQYRVDPFTAASLDYASVLLTWSEPSGTILAYRLIRNRFGYPSNQDDGEILIDSTNYPGSTFVDHDIIPGQYHYYGFYVLLNFTGNVWVRSATTACLTIKDYNFHDKLIHPLVPGVFTNRTGFGEIFTVNQGIPVESSVGELFVPPGEDTDFHNFVNVIAWGMNLLKTQYDTYQHVNDPWQVSQAELYNLATELGIDINPDIHPYTLRKAVFNNAVINKERGTTSGLANEVSSLTGWNLDLTIGQNFMLENDQSEFLDPIYQTWSANISYLVGEKVGFGNFWYQCISTGNLGNAPTGTSSSNTWWQAILNTTDTTVLHNATTGFINTWEPLYPSVSNGVTTGTAISETIGVADPLNTSDFSFNSLQVKNNGGSPQNVWIRSIARTPADISVVTTTFAPNKFQAINDGIPVPYSLPSQVWNPLTEYDTTDIITFNNQPFIALRASTNALPPYTSIGGVSPEWQPISMSTRYRIMVSAYVTGSSAVQVYPFVEWYDDQGAFIMRVVARNQTPGTVAFPNALAHDSFTTRATTTLDGTRTNDGNFTWVQQAGVLELSPFANGTVFPLVPSTRTYAIINSGVSDTQVGITFVTSPSTNMTQALFLRWTDDSHYLRADRTSLKINNGGVYTTLGAYSTPCFDGDRLTVTLSGSSIGVFVNQSEVLSVTSGFNQTAVRHGFGVENI